jgi:DNA-directed RNA polymerase specialized sigma24 family protein
MQPSQNVEQQKLWARAYADAVRYAFYLTRNKTRAEDLAAEAMVAAFDPDRSPWRPDGDLTLSQHVIRLVRELMRSEARKDRRRNDPSVVAAAREAMRPSVPRPDARILASERAARGAARTAQVRAKLDPFAQKVLDLFGEGLSRKEQAMKLGVDVQDVYRACERIAARIRALPDEAPDNTYDEGGFAYGAGGTLDGEPQDSEPHDDGGEAP